MNGDDIIPSALLYQAGRQAIKIIIKCHYIPKNIHKYTKCVRSLPPIHGLHEGRYRNHTPIPAAIHSCASSAFLIRISSTMKDKILTISVMVPPNHPGIGFAGLPQNMWRTSPGLMDFPGAVASVTQRSLSIRKGTRYAPRRRQSKGNTNKYNPASYPSGVRKPGTPRVRKALASW